MPARWAETEQEIVQLSRMLQRIHADLSLWSRPVRVTLRNGINYTAQITEVHTENNGGQGGHWRYRAYLKATLGQGATAQIELLEMASIEPTTEK